jgi:hypothetical protein
MPQYRAKPGYGPGVEVDVGVGDSSIVLQGISVISTGPFGLTPGKAVHMTVPACDQSAVEAAPRKIPLNGEIFSRVRAFLAPFSHSSVSQHLP